MAQVKSLQMQQGLRQILRMEQANLLEIPEADFQSLIVETEHSPLFQSLLRREKLIRYKRFPRTDFSPRIFKIGERAVADDSPTDVESLLVNREEVVLAIKKIGQVMFKRLFLFPEECLTLEETALECGLDVETVKKINNLIDDVSIATGSHNASTVASGRIHYSKIAAIVPDEKGFIVNYFSPANARGYYSIDYENFEVLVASGKFEKEAVTQARFLFRKLELINSRKNTLNRILQQIVEKQTDYLDSGDAKSLMTCTQKELAGKLGIAPSSVSRAISGKSVEAPWKQEIPLKRFFVRPNKFKKELINQLVSNDKTLSSDEAIRIKLWQTFGVAISRRSVAALRRQLNMPALHERKR